MKRMIAARALLLALLLALAGCERTMRDMYDQPRYKPLAPSPLWPDGALVAHAAGRHVARSEGTFAGTTSGARHDRAAPARRSIRSGRARRARPPRKLAIRRAIDAAQLLARGRERFDIYCVALPQRRRRRRRHGRAARLSASAVVPHRPAARRARRAFLRGDQRRLRRDVFVRRRASRPPTGCAIVGLHPRAAAQPARAARRARARTRAAAVAARRPPCASRERRDERRLARPAARLAPRGDRRRARARRRARSAPCSSRARSSRAGLRAGCSSSAIALGAHGERDDPRADRRRVGAASLRRPLEAAMLTLPLLRAARAAARVRPARLFEWARPEAVAASGVLQAKRWYLNCRLSSSRDVVWLAVWIAFAVALQRRLAQRGRRRRARAAPHLGRRPARLLVDGDARRRRLGRVARRPTGTRPRSAFASARRSSSPRSRSPSPFAALDRERRGARPRARVARDYGDFGNLLLTFAMFWAYIAFMQYFIVWAEDLPHGTAWYWPRMSTAGAGLRSVVLALDFALPFVRDAVPRLQAQPRRARRRLR